MMIIYFILPTSIIYLIYLKMMNLIQAIGIILLMFFFNVGIGRF